MLTVLMKLPNMHLGMLGAGASSSTEGPSTSAAAGAAAATTSGVGASALHRNAGAGTDAGAREVMCASLEQLQREMWGSLGYFFPSIIYSAGEVGGWVDDWLAQPSVDEADWDDSPIALHAAVVRAMPDCMMKICNTISHTRGPGDAPQPPSCQAAGFSQWTGRCHQLCPGGAV